MSNYQLRAEVSRLQSELSAIEAENSALRSEIGTAVGAVVAAEHSLVETNNHINNSLGNANESLSLSHQRVIQAYEMQQEMDVIYSRLKNMELANKEIRRCNNIKYYDFETYRKTRKIVQGIMDNMDFSMVSPSLIESVVEKEHLESPVYWLTALLIAIVSWQNNQKERAYRSLRQALTLDAKRTASFLLVFYLRVDREEVAFRWFDQLLDGQLMGSDKPMILLFFSLLSKTIEDDVSDSARGKVSAYIRKLIEDEISSSETSRSAAVKRISASFRTFADDFNFPYPQITKYVSTAGKLKSSLALARNNANIVSFIANTVDVEDSIRNEFLKQYIDRIVADPCPEEARIYDEIERNELIIKFQGDKEAALSAFEKAKEHDEAKFDIVNEMLDWVYTIDGRAEANSQMRKNMFVLTRSLQQDAGNDYVKFYQSLFKPTSQVSINGFEGEIDMSHPEASDSQIEAHFHECAAQEKAQVKDIPAYITMGVGAVVGVGAAIALGPAMAIIGVICVAVGAGMLLINNSKKKRITLKYEQKTRSTKAIVKEIGDEYKTMESEYKEADLLSGEMENRLASL